MSPEGLGTDYGSGTGFCMKVTVKQLEKLFYRVRDTKLISGSYYQTWYDSGGPEFPILDSIEVLNGTQPEELGSINYDEGFYTYSVRGYTIPAFSLPSTDPPTYNGPALWDWFFDPVYPLTDWGAFAGNLPSLLYNTWGRDINREWGMWAPIYHESYPTTFGVHDKNYPSVYWPLLYSPYGDPLSYVPFVPLTSGCAYNRITGWGADYDGSQVAPPSTYNTVYTASDDGLAQGYSPALLNLVFSGRVAVVDIAGDGNPYNPANELWVQLYFMVTPGYSYPFLFSYPYITSFNAPNYLDTPLAPCGVNLVLELDAADSVSCELYSEGPTSMFLTGYGGTDFTISAISWWEFKYPPTGGPMWDTESGVQAGG